MTGAPGRSTWWATSRARSSTAGTGTRPGRDPTRRRPPSPSRPSPSSRPLLRPAYVLVSVAVEPGRRAVAGPGHLPHDEHRPAAPAPGPRPACRAALGRQPVERGPQRGDPPHPAERLPPARRRRGSRRRRSRRARPAVTRSSASTAAAGEQRQVGGEQAPPSADLGIEQRQPGRRRGDRAAAGRLLPVTRTPAGAAPAGPTSDPRRRRRRPRPAPGRASAGRRPDSAGLSTPPIRRAAPTGEHHRRVRPPPGHGNRPPPRPGRHGRIRTPAPTRPWTCSYARADACRAALSGAADGQDGGMGRAD